MADSTIANLTSGAPAQATDVLPIQRGAANFKLAVSDVLGALTSLPNGTTATTQTALSNDTKVATNAYTDVAVAVEKTRALAAEAAISLVATIDLTPTLIKNMDNTVANAVTLIAAPGTGKVIVPTFVVANIQFAGTPYADGGGSMQLAYAVGASLSNFFTNTAITSTDSEMAQGPVGTHAQQIVSVISGQPLLAMLSTAPKYTTGNSHIFVTIWYTIQSAS